MKRDMDLVRTLLLLLEEKGDGQGFTDNDGILKAHDPGVVVYHWTIMHEAGLIEGSGGSSTSGMHFFPQRLTWFGHEFLDHARDDTVWREAKAKLGTRFAKASFDMIQTVLAKLISDTLGLGQ